MMKIRIAINGFGRIGRNAFRIAFDREDVEVVAINDLSDNQILAHLLRHDTNYGQYHHKVEVGQDELIIDGQAVKTFNKSDPAELPWSDLDVDVVIESTGVFRTTDAAMAHVKAGAKRVVISSPAKDDQTPTVVLGANEDVLKESQAQVISCASCTTNSLAAVTDVLNQSFGIKKAFVTTVHSYTADQRLQDAPHKDYRRARAAAANIVPTTTGAAIATTKTVPELKNKFGGMAVRVPTPVVSLSDITMLLAQPTSIDDINNKLKQTAADPYYQGIISVTDEPLVSSDLIGNSHSAIVDLGLTDVVDGDLAKVVVWYDNEWGYCNRLVELSSDVGKAVRQ